MDISVADKPFVNETERMDILDADKPSSQSVSDYDRGKELKAFDETKAGVKGLVDSGILKIPRIFIRPPDELAVEKTIHQTDFQVPVIDLGGLRENKLEKIVDQVRAASETWGFFQVINHGVPLIVLEEMIEGICKFNEQDLEVKKEFYSRDRTRNVKLVTNFDLYLSRTANWRDTLNIAFWASSFDPNELPEVCRDTTMEFIENVRKLGDVLFELLSMALGLKPAHLRDMGCSKGCNSSCHYYPPCPEPELTLGTSSHSDPSFITILLQDQIGGLQVSYESQWVDVHPIAGGLVVNIGDFLQAISNDKFKSVDHRVVAKHVGPRVSVACFYTGQDTTTPKVYEPIKELTSEEHPPIYKDFLLSDYFAKFSSMALNGKSGLDFLKR